MHRDGMSAGEPMQLGLEVRFDAQPIQGRVYDQGDHRRLNQAFSGWLGLIAALEAASGSRLETSRERKGDSE